MNKFVMRTGSAMMTSLLRSPIHALISGNTLLIVLTGHKTGREYSLPVNYIQDGDALYIISKRGRTWWRNLRGGKPVRVWLCGHQVNGNAMIDEEYASILETLKSLFQKRPDMSRYFGVRLESKDQPNTQDMARLAQERVLVKVCLDGFELA